MLKKLQAGSEGEKVGEKPNGKRKNTNSTQNIAFVKSVHAMNTLFFYILIDLRAFHFNCRFRKK
jgi:hypothetical protein